MSEKNQNRNRTKIVAAIALTIIIGIASVVPLTFFITTRAQASDESWFNIDLPRAYLNAAVTDDGYRLTGGIAYDVSPNYAAISEDVNARVEYLEFALYIDDLQFIKNYMVLGTDRPGLENPTNMDAVRAEVWYNIPWIEKKIDLPSFADSDLPSFADRVPNRYGGGSYGGTNGSLCVEWMDIGHAGRYTQYECNIIDITDDAILAALEYSQTIYFDIRRIACITFDGNGITTVLESDQLIQHVELTKNSNGEFTFGDLTAIENALDRIGQHPARTTISVKGPVHISGSYLVE
jgi:hypothetical protein